MLPAPPAVSAPAAITFHGGRVGSNVAQLKAESYDSSYRRHHGHTESYDKIDENPFRSVSDDPLSTFSIDVDTASYANVRRFLNEGTMPPVDAVRIEELINYFHFDYPQPKAHQPFSIRGEDPEGYRAEFIRLMEVASALARRESTR